MQDVALPIGLIETGEPEQGRGAHATTSPR